MYVWYVPLNSTYLLTWLVKFYLNTMVNGYCSYRCEDIGRWRDQTAAKRSCSSRSRLSCREKRRRCWDFCTRRVQLKQNGYSQSNLPDRYRNSHAIQDHTLLQSWHSRPYPSRSWYSIKRPRRDARLSWPSWGSAPTHLSHISLSKPRPVTTSLAVLCDRVTRSITGHITTSQLLPSQRSYGPGDQTATVELG